MRVGTLPVTRTVPFSIPMIHSTGTPAPREATSTSFFQILVYPFVMHILEIDRDFFNYVYVMHAIRGWVRK